MSYLAKRFVQQRLNMIGAALMALQTSCVDKYAPRLDQRNASKIHIEPLKRDTTPRVTPRLKRLAKMYRFPLSQKARRNVSRQIQRITERWRYHPKEWRHACWCKACLSWEDN